MPSPLDTLIAALRADRGLAASLPAADISAGIDAARDLNRVLLAMIDQTNANDDRRITAGDMQAVSDALWLPKNAQPWRDFYIAHGNDNGDVESGFHNVQDDGGRLVFQGRNFVDTVADAIYHYGFRIENGRYFNEDGNDNEEIADVAGWLNFFLNGENSVYGSGRADELHSGDYSEYFAAARNETFLAGAGDDSIWADVGNDRVYGGTGDDRSGGGTGADRMWGGAGDDTLYGEEGRDFLFGGTGYDELGSGDGDDEVDGGDGRDTVWADAGDDLLRGGEAGDRLDGGADNDTLRGEAGFDEVMGSDGGDQLYGGGGNDSLWGGAGADYIAGGTGADEISLWEQWAMRDTVVLAPGDSGRTPGTIDVVEGFAPGKDKINLVAFGEMRFGAIDFTGGGASCYFDGDHLRIDANGDRATDMLVELRYVDELAASDFVFA
jgi:Ca2+-binding RTX toxin-like protein